MPSGAPRDEQKGDEEKTAGICCQRRRKKNFAKGIKKTNQGVSNKIQQQLAKLSSDGSDYTIAKLKSTTATTSALG